MLPIAEFVAALAAWGYQVKPRYYMDLASGRDTCYPCDFIGKFGETPVEVSISPNDGGWFSLICRANGRYAACFKLWPHYHGWRLEYWSHWGNWFRGHASAGAAV